MTISTGVQDSLEFAVRSNKLLPEIHILPPSSVQGVWLESSGISELKQGINGASAGTNLPGTGAAGTFC